MASTIRVGWAIVYFKHLHGNAALKWHHELAVTLHLVGCVQIRLSFVQY